MNRLSRTWALTFLSAGFLSCTGAAPGTSTVPRVPVNPSIKVGSIVAVHSGTPLCTPGAVPTTTTTGQGKLSRNSSVYAGVEVKLTDQVNASLNGKYVDSIDIELHGGQIEGSAADIAARRWEKLPRACREQIRQSEEGGESEFATVLAVYRGKLTISTKLAAGADASAKAKLMAELQGSLGAKADSTSSDQFLVENTVIALQTQPLSVPDPRQDTSIPPDDEAAPAAVPSASASAPSAPQPMTTSPSATAPTDPPAATAAPASPPASCSVKCEGSGEATRLRFVNTAQYRLVLKSKTIPGSSKFNVLSTSRNAELMLVGSSSLGDSFTVASTDALSVCSKLDGTGGGCHWGCSEDNAAHTVKLFTNEMNATFAVSCEGK